jgi:GDP-L-fucose synthase
MTHQLKTLPTDSRIFLAGHRGMVGSAIHRLLIQNGYKNIITRTSSELDLTEQQGVRSFFQSEKIDYVVLAAARVGGIHANFQYPAEFIYLNQMIQSNVIHQAYMAGVRQLLFLGSSCIYPKHAPQPMKEEHLLTGILEPTNEPYAIAKISGIKMCESYNRQYKIDYRAVMPTNLYGPGDNYHLENSHVIPAIMRKYHLAKLASAGDFSSIEKDQEIFGPVPDEIAATLGFGNRSPVTSPYVQLWGTGRVKREFLHVEDMASACVHLMKLSQESYEQGLRKTSGSFDPEFSRIEGSDPGFFNIGTGHDCTIGEVAEIIREIVGFDGETRYNSDQPDGTPRKLLDTSRINGLGWFPSYGLKEGLKITYDWYCSQCQRQGL